MSAITHAGFDFGSDGYEFEVDFDDRAAAENAIFEITARKEDGYRPSERATALVRFETERGMLAIEITGVNGSEFSDFNLQDINTDNLEFFVDNLPVQYILDPILACAIKAGLHAAIYQIMECYNNLIQTDPRRRLAEFIQCLVSHFGVISRMALYRLFRCIAGYFGIPVN